MFGSSLPPVVCRRAHVLFRMFGSSLPPVVCRRAHVLLRMFGSSLPPVVCKRAHVFFTLFVFVCVKWCPMHIVLCFVFLRLVWPMLRVSLDRPFLIAPLVFSNVYWNSIMPNSVIYCWSFQMHPAKKLAVVVISFYYKLHPRIMVNHHVVNKWCK